MPTQPNTSKPLTPLRVIRQHCRQCLPEPRGEYLRCPTIECPLWRFRVGNVNRFGRGGFARAADAHSCASKSPKTSATAEARAKILMAEARAKLGGKPHVDGVEWWGPDSWPGYKAGERAVRAIGRTCHHCMGDAKPAECCSPNCALARFRFGRQPRPGDQVPVPNIPAYLRGAKDAANAR